MNQIFKRASVRKFLPKQVEAAKIEMVLRAAMAAPSAGNQQPWEFYVVEDKAILAQLAKASLYAGCVQQAPMAVIPCWNRSKLRFPEYALLDMSAAVENLLLEAVSLDLGAVWLGIAPEQDRMDRVHSILGMSEDLTVFAIIPLGYPEKLVKANGETRFSKEKIHYIG